MFTGPMGLAAQDIRETSTVQKVALGTVGVTRDGRSYTYSSITSAGLTRGLLGIAEAVVSNHTNRVAAAAAAIGDLEVRLSLGATAAAKDLYADGFLVVNDATGEGVAYSVAGNSAVSSSGGTCIVRLNEPVTVALVASTSEASLIKNPNGSVTSSTTISKAAGVANVTFAASTFGWLQKKGVCSTLADGVTAKGVNAIQSGSVAGAVATMTDSTAATTDTREIVGVALEALVDTEHRAVVLNIG